MQTTNISGFHEVKLEVGDVIARIPLIRRLLVIAEKL